MQIKPLPRRHYPHAPITEAIIAISYQLPDGVGVRDIENMQPELRPDYAKRAEQLAVQFEVNAAERVGKTARPEVLGYQYLSQDQKRIVRVTRTEFAYSQLAPYDRWETLQSEARRLWDLVERFLRPRRITRVGVRFVNRIDIPNLDEKGIDLDLYFHAAPRIPAELPQTMSTYFVRVEMPYNEPSGVLILSIAAAPPARPHVISTLLDVDAIKKDVEMNSAEAWKAIEELRDVKNAAFEASITDAARELFR